LDNRKKPKGRNMSSYARFTRGPNRGQKHPYVFGRTIEENTELYQSSKISIRYHRG